jgi:hypothetical protein
MIKLWPSMDQLTPRAGPNGQERPNPFEVSSSPAGSGHHTPTAGYHQHQHHQHHHHHHLLLNTHNQPSTPINTDFSPWSNSVGNFAAALPTTQLSIHAPDFNMQQPPSSAQRSIPNKPSTTSPSPTPSGSPPKTGPSKGQIHVKLIQARTLNVRSVNARPYVVVQFEQNEFVSRDPTNESDKEVKGTATNLSRNGSSNALSALGAIGSRVALDAAKRGKGSANSSPSSSVLSLSPPLVSIPNTTSLFGRLSAHNPVWKHEVSLYVICSLSTSL